MADKSSQQTGYYTKEDAFQSLEIINSWINNMDTKISFAMAFISVLIGFIFSNDLPDVFDEIAKLEKIQQITPGQTVSVLLVLILYGACLACIGFLVAGLTARTKNTTPVTSIFFFGDIAKRTRDDVLDNMSNITEKKLLADLQNQIYINSQICTKKSMYFNKGLYCFVASVVIYVLCTLLQIL